MTRRKVTIDGNEAASYVAHKVSEVCAIYPITPSSPMGELADEWSSKGAPNIWGTIPHVVEMQSEGGASAAVHGALQTGALSTTFTASQGLLLMIPTMFKIAGELTPTVFHVTARTVASHALSIFGDHSDVMAVRSTGFGQIASGSIQEIMDLALISHATTLKARIPFVHFFDGFRSSHEVMKIEQLLEDDIRAMIDDDLVAAHRARAMNPDKPVLRGTAQNPDVFFQARETVNPFYNACPDVVQEMMDKFAKIVGRQYHLFDYVGDPEADRVIVIMGSGAEAVHETVDALAANGEKVGLIKVRLFRPFAGEKLIAALPKSVKTIAVLDRTKEPGSAGEPLYQDVVTALHEHQAGSGNHFASTPCVIGGRYGLSSKEFNSAMVKGLYDEMAKPKPKNHFTIGINDDVTNSSIEYDPDYSTEGDDVVRAMFYGLGSDGTVGANKNSIKIIGEGTENYAQGYFVYDSKKAGSVTVSHLRFGPRPIHSTYLIREANFIGCHQQVFLEKLDVLANATDGAVFLLNSQAGPDTVWDTIPKEVQQQVIDKKLKFYVIDAYKVAAETGMGARINTIMQTCFFAISGVLPQDEAISKIKEAIQKTYGKRGEKVVQMNFAAVDQAVANLHQVDYPGSASSKLQRQPAVSEKAPEFVRNVLGKMITYEGDDLPVSAMPCDGTFPTATAKWEKRSIALEIPVWDKETCIQCNKCAMVCPHAAIRPKAYDAAVLEKAPSTFKSIDAKGPEFKGMKFTIQVAPEDCTGCGMCIEACPAKNKENPELRAINLSEQPPIRMSERENFDFFLGIPEFDRTKLKTDTVKGSQFLRPLFEYSGACAGCGETPYVKLVSQLFGDRMIMSNATGCSSIYGGNLPTTPWCTDDEGCGPTWCNSLFEDNAEFGFGFRLTMDKHQEYARELLTKMRDQVGGELADRILQANQTEEAGIIKQRQDVRQLKKKLEGIDGSDSRNLLGVADALIQRSVWICGGDGWAFDIGYGGLDHVLASGRNVNVLVLDTEVYSNTGGQMSKSTPIGAVAKFAAGGKEMGKKDLGMMAMTYGNVYVAQVAFGASDRQTVKAIVEAESYDGPSLILAYSHCISHGINMRVGMDHQQAAVDSGHYILYRYDPRLKQQGKNPLQIDSKEPKIPFRQYAEMENRYRMLLKSQPERASELLEIAQAQTTARWEHYQRLAAPTK